MFDAVSGEQMRNVQMLTGVAMAVAVGAGLAPPLRPYAGKIRAGVLVLYCVAFAGLLINWQLRLP